MHNLKQFHNSLYFVTWNRDQERIETLWTDSFEDLLVEETEETEYISEDPTDESPRTPRQTQGNKKEHLEAQKKGFCV